MYKDLNLVYGNSQQILSAGNIAKSARNRQAKRFPVSDINFKKRFMEKVW